MNYCEELEKKKHTERHRKIRSREAVFTGEYAEEKNTQRMLGFLVSYNFN